MRYFVVGFSLALVCACSSRGGLEPLTRTAPAAQSFGIAVPTGASKVPLDSAIAEIAGQASSTLQTGIIMALIGRSDEVCEKHMTDTIIPSNGLSSRFNIGSLGLTGLAGTLKPIGTSQALAAGATFATGTDTYLSTKVLRGNAPVLIYKSVMAERTKERSRIIRLMELGTPPLILTADLQNYHSMCDITAGINALNAVVTDAEDRAGTTGKEKASAARLSLQTSQTAIKAAMTPE